MGSSGYAALGPGLFLRQFAVKPTAAKASQSSPFVGPLELAGRNIHANSY
jgi:hypothetical protein